MFHGSSVIARVWSGMALILSLAACGGGDSSPSPPPVTGFTLSGANAPRVTAEALRAALTNVAYAWTFDSSSAAAAVSRQVLRASMRPTIARATSAVRPLAVTACAEGGSVTESGAFTDIGSSVTLTFADCQEGGDVLNGTVRTTLVAVTSGTDLTVDVTLTNLEVTKGGVVKRANGTLRMHFVEDTLFPQRFTTSTTSSLLASERLVNGALRASISMRDLTLQDLVEEATRVTRTASFVASGTFSELGDVSFQVQTVAALVTPVDQTHPTSGQLRISAAGGATVLVTVTADQVQMALDIDGNGTVDEALTRSWDQMELL